MPATIVAKSLSKQFILRHNRSPSLKSRLLGIFYPHQRETLEKFLALDNVSVAIDKGDTVGLIGRNGSGKSTFLKLIAGIHRPTSGHLLVSADARIGTMIELGVGFHPDLNGTENVFLGAAIHGLSRPQIEELYPRVVEYSGLKHFMTLSVHAGAFSRASRFADAYCGRTFVQSHCSSSQTIMALEVQTPWPSSVWAMRMVTMSSGAMTIQALISGVADRKHLVEQQDVGV